MPDCLICCDSYNKTDRRPVQCVFCEYETCLGCQKRYILSSAQDAHCMNCKKRWNRKILTYNFPQSFLKKDYLIHRENILFDREQSLLPATQAILPAILNRRGLEKMLRMISLEQNRLNSRLFDEESRRLELEYLRSLVLYKIMVLNNYNQKEETKKYVMKCPNGECRGFLSTRYKCDLCQHRICAHCHVALEEKHDCDPDLVKTVEELKKTTKNCPNCQVPIFKSSGCDQMWCVSCHTAFNWKTGVIEKGIIHNPEYFDFLRRSGISHRNPRDPVCGGMPEFHRVMRICFTRQETDAIQTIYQLIVHVRHDTMRRLPTAMDNQSNQDLRIGYLLKDITEEDFKIQLQKREKELEKKIEYRQVLDTFVMVGEELFRQLVESQLEINFLYKQMVELMNMINEQISSINYSYQCKLGLIEVSLKVKDYMLSKIK